MLVHRLPIQRAFLPDPDEAGQQNGNKDHHLDKARYTQLPESHRPRVEENHFDVEENKNHRDQVVADWVAALALANRAHAGLIRHQFLGIIGAAARPKQNRYQHDQARQPGRHNNQG